MKRIPTLFTVPAAAAALTLSLAACGGDDGHGGSATPDHSTGSASTAPPSARPATGRHNAADIMFAQMMIPHHEQAVEMTKLVPSRASMPEIKRLAAEIEKAQSPEIRQMTAWLKDWNAPVSAPDIEHMGHSMPGIVSAADMDKLEKSTGRAFDKLFLKLMIEHHQGAIAMAKTERSEGTFAAAKTMADAITTSQSAEIAQMRGLLKKA